MLILLLLKIIDHINFEENGNFAELNSENEIVDIEDPLRRSSRIPIARCEYWNIDNCNPVHYAYNAIATELIADSQTKKFSISALCMIHYN